MLELYYAAQEDIPAGYENLYTERNGRWEITGVKGMKTDADVTALNESLRKERKDHRATKEQLSAVNTTLNHAGIGIEDLASTLDRIGELGEDKDADARIEARVKSRIAPLEREVTTLRAANTDLENNYKSLLGEKTTRNIRDAVYQAATKAGIKDPSVLDDIRMYADTSFTFDEDLGQVVTRETQVDPAVWLADMKEKRPYWWPSNIGGGAGGGAGTQLAGGNPFTAKNWNLTEQGKLYRENPTKAEQMAKAAGTSIGGTKPTE